MTYPDVIPADRSSITDLDSWRDFCLRAALDLSLLQDSKVLDYVIGDSAELRYRLIANRLEELFGSWQGWHILEVGGGYGGQARLLMERFACSYSILDLPEPRALQSAYLRQHGLRLVEYPAPADLFVSNYAVSEGSRPMQVGYMHLAAECPRGYVTWNGWTHDALTADEFLALIPGAEWLPELPSSNDANRCLVWG